MPLDQPIAMLTNKYGPLPGYAYIGIGGVAFFLYRRHQQAKAGNGVTPTDNTGDINATGGQVPPAGYAYDQSGNLTSLATDPATGDPYGYYTNSSGDVNPVAPPGFYYGPDGTLLPIPTTGTPAGATGSTTTGTGTTPQPLVPGTVIFTWKGKGKPNMNTIEQAVINRTPSNGHGIHYKLVPIKGGYNVVSI